MDRCVGTDDPDTLNSSKERDKKFAETLTRAADANLLVLLGFTEGLSGYEPCKDASDGRESREHDLNMSSVNSVAEPV